MLRSTVITTMTVSQVFVEIFEGFVPFLMYRKRTKNHSKKFESLSDQMKYEKLRDEYEGICLILRVRPVRGRTLRFYFQWHIFKHSQRKF